MTKHPRQRRLRAALAAVLLLLLTPAAARPHWMAPQEIVAGIQQDPILREHLGVVDASIDPKLSRLLLITIRRATWDTVAPEKRIGMAQLWYETWRHNVDQGIVAILAEGTEKSLVHFDAEGKASLVEAR